MVNRARAATQLVLHEGLRLQVYLDDMGNLTFGVGYNVDARGWDFFEQICGHAITDGTCEKIDAIKVLNADILRVETALRVHWPFYDNLSEVRQRVVLDMAFNMGFRVAGFKATKAAIEAGDWSRAAMEMCKSKWARQVHGRADRLAKMLLTGLDFVA